jgi:hydroxypyruvate isomerase
MSKLRQSVPDWCFFKQGTDPRGYYARVKALGYDGVELVDESRWAAAREAGLRIVDLAAPGMQDGVNKKANHGTLLPQIRQALETAKANGIPNVIVFSGNRQGLDDAEGLKGCAAAYRELARDAERLGVTMLFEMLNAYDHPDYMADSARFGFDVVQAVGSPRFKVLYDVYHMHRMKEDALADMLAHLDVIEHVHVAGSPRRDFPGTLQEIDYATIVRRVAEAGYKGFWGQEFIPVKEPLAELEAAVMLFNRYASPEAHHAP